MKKLHPCARGTALLAVVLSLAACRSDDALPARLQERLEALLDGKRSTPSSTEVTLALSRQLRVAPPVAGGGSGSAAKPVFPTREMLSDFYARRARSLAWCDAGGRVLPRFRTLMAALERADQHGLDPQDYTADLLRAQRWIDQDAKDASTAASRLADFDLLATAACLRYASDLSTGRVHPDEVREDWHTNPPEIDLVSALQDALDRDALGTLLQTLPPPYPGYARLCEALATLREVQAAGGWPVVPPGSTSGPRRARRLQRPVRRRTGRERGREGRGPRTESRPASIRTVACASEAQRAGTCVRAQVARRSES